MYKLPNFKEKKELFDYLVKNEDDILYAKKQELKRADGFAGVTISLDKTIATKANESTGEAKDYVDVIVVINTTKLLDSHGDVHIDGIWDKSLSENTRIKHLQEHKMAFDTIIADKDDLKAYVKEYSWKELGYKAEGKTQALVFESRVRKTRNPFMFKQYKEGNVDNHSVGMRYVKIVTCINDEEYEVQKENWDKYYPMVANKEDADNQGYFWAVTEAKVIEGSAVPIGSNPITPTTSTSKTEVKTEKKKDPYKSWLGLE